MLPQLRNASSRLLGAIGYWLSGIVPRQQNLVIFGAWRGKRYADNPRYLFEYLADHRPDLQLVWIGDPETTPDLARFPRARFVATGSRQALLARLRAGSVFVSHGLGDVGRHPISRGSRRVYLGHGLAIKRMGAPLPSETNPIKRRARNILLRPRTFDYWLASSETHANKLLAENQPQLIEPVQVCRLGQPRLDHLHPTNGELIESATLRVRERLKAVHGIPISGRLVAYLPTFRDSGQAAFNFSQHDGPSGEDLRRVLTDHNAWVVEKRHQADSGSGSGAGLDRMVDVATDPAIDTQDLLAASDILVSDYSGCFVDYLLLNRPIIHFAYDRDEYTTRDRGLYFDLDDVAAGEIVESVDDLVVALDGQLSKVGDDSTDTRRRKQLADRLLSEEAGSSTRRVAEYFFPTT